MPADEPEQRRCPKVLERQMDGGSGAIARGSSEMKITAAPSADDGPCVVCGSEKDPKSEPCAGDKSTTHKHAVPWPHVEPWRKNVALAGIFFGIFFSTLDTTIIATSLISIVEDLGDFTMSPWIILSYLLTYMSFAMAFARFSDIYGRKPLMLIAWTLFMTFSLGCALSRTLLQLIVFRAFQGLGGAGLYSIGMVMMAEILKTLFTRNMTTKVPGREEELIVEEPLEIPPLPEEQELPQDITDIGRPPSPSFEQSLLEAGEPQPPEELGVVEPVEEERLVPSESWSERTLKMQRFLATSFTKTRASELSFKQLVEGQPKKVVAGAFFEFLVLKTRNHIDLRQEEPYGDILVTKTPKFGVLTTPRRPIAPPATPEIGEQQA